MATHLRLRIAIMFSVIIKVMVIIMLIPFTMANICIIFTNGSHTHTMAPIIIITVMVICSPS